MALSYVISSNNKELLIYGLIPFVPFFLLCVLFILIKEKEEGKSVSVEYFLFN